MCVWGGVTLDIFYRFHSLRKRASFQHSYMASTAKAKNSSVVGGAIRDVTTRTYVRISVDRTVKSLCASGCFKSHSEGISSNSSRLSSLVPQTPIRAHADRGSGNILYNELF